MPSNKEIIRQMLEVELARKNLYYFSKTSIPELYTANRPYLRTMCNIIQEWYEDPDDGAILIINAPPQSGKTTGVNSFKKWALGKNPNERIITISYNELLSTKFGKRVRDDISEVKTDPDNLVYKDIFPHIKIKRGSSSAKLWSIEGAKQDSMLSTSPNGTLTGFGSTLCIIDDLIRSSEQAYNDNELEKHWNFYTDTLKTRIRGKLLVTFTRWNSKDLCGRLMKFYDDNNIKYKLLSIKAEDEQGRSFCEAYMTTERMKIEKKTLSEEIWNANYNQVPIDTRGRLYTRFNDYNYADLVNTLAKENKTIHTHFNRVISYTDTADTGFDNLTSIIAGVDRLGNIYILDVLHTKEAMEYTEPALTNLLQKWKVTDARIESNNGGRGFARNISRLLEELKNYTCQITTFSQTKNKVARILSNSNNVMTRVYFPTGWDIRYPEFFNDIVAYQKTAKAKTDDAPDALTGLYEMTELMGYYN